MQIKVIAVSVENKGKYDQVEVTYKNQSFQDKVESKKVMSFINKEVFNTLKSAKADDVFTITRVKNDKGYWDWSGIESGTGNSVDTYNAAAVAPSGAANKSPKSTYETAEERAQRQVLIVRQSALAQAVATTTVGAKGKLVVDEVLQVAQTYYDWVFENDKKPIALADLPPNDGDDIPY